MAFLQSLEQHFWPKTLSLHLNPAAEMIRRFEMGVIGSESGQALSLGQKLIKQIPAITPVVFNGAAVIVDFNRVGTVNGAAVFHGEL